MTNNNPYYRPSSRSTLGFGQPASNGANRPVPGGHSLAARKRLNTGDSSNYTRSGRIRTGITFAIAYLVVIWAVFLVNQLVFGGGLNSFGIRPLDFTGIWGIFFAPLLHANLEHIISNSIPGAIFCFLIGLSGKKAWWEVTLIAGLVAGLGTWLLGGPGTLHIGASGLVYGWLAYLIVRGIFNRSLLQTVLGIVLGVAYSGLIWGVLPLVEGISWQGHFFGALGGILAGMVITSDDTIAQLRRRRAKQIRGGAGRG